MAPFYLPKRLLVAALLALATLHAPASVAQDGSHSYDHDRVRVLDRGRGFLVSVQDDNGTSPEHAGHKAMEWACRISLERGFPRMGVEEFETGTASLELQTAEARTDYAQDINGNYVEAGGRPAEYETRVRGTASLAVVMMSAEAASGMLDAFQMIDANSCTIMN